jgi:hypothetical protein
MGPAPGRDPRTTRLLLVGVALLVLLAIVALASRSGFGHASASRPTPGYVSWAMSVFLVLFVLAIPFAAWLYANQQRHVERTQRSYQARVARSLAILFAIMLLGLAAAWLRRSGHLPNLATFLSTSSGGRHAGGLNHSAAPYSPSFKWPVLWATIGVVAATGIGLFWLGRRRPPLEQDVIGEPAEDELVTSIDDAIDDLEAEPDARLAVIAAYARMERTLGRSGIGRAASETPLEYLRRVLLTRTTSRDAVSRLTGLFERAKFSRQEIDTPMKQDAIAALREIRDGLAPA